MSDPRVLLIVMPWANPEYPSLSLGLLQAILNREGLACDTLYANLAFARYLDDWPLYRHMCYAAEGDAAFTPSYFGTAVEPAARVIQERTGRHSYAPLADRSRCTRLVRDAGDFVDWLFATVQWERYDIIGFSLMFQQLLASLSLARRIKERYPHKRVVFGGPSCDGEMGLQMLAAFPHVDFVVSGEADETIVPFIREVRAQARAAHPRFTTPGIAYRDESGAVVFTEPPGLTHLDALPYPDYDPYFQQLAAAGISDLEPVLYMEASRGCWWGEKSHCSFCGLNGLTMKYRSKSPDRVYAEILHLAGRYRIAQFWTSDNILDYRSFDTLLPRLAALREQQGVDLQFFFEIKSNVTREKVRQMRDAGITWVQPGIESFSDGILKRMRKGCTGIQQMHALRLFAEFGMDVDWNIIYANPNDQPEDYAEMTRMVPFLHHLPPPPPSAVVPMALHRFSPYHTNPAAHGIANLRPADFYRAVFPDPQIELEKLVYVFEFDHESLGSPALQAAQQEFFQAVQRWRESYRPQALTYRRGPGFVRIIDRRDPGTEQLFTLVGVQAEIYLFCDSVRSEEAIRRRFADAAAPEALRRFLDQMVGHRLMYRSSSGQYLSLALQDHTGRTLQVQDAVAATLGQESPPGHTADGP